MTREKIYVRKLKDGSSRWLVATPLGGTIARVSSYLAALKPTSFTYAFTKMEEAGWLREGRSASRFILSEPGCRHLGVEYVGPMDWDEES